MFALELRGKVWERHHLELESDDGVHQTIYVSPDNDETATIVWEYPGSRDLRQRWNDGDYAEQHHVLIDEKE